MDWELVAWVKRGKRRISILRLLKLSSSPLTANEIKYKLKIAISQASFTLKELSEKSLIECLNPNDKIGKLYKIIKKGEMILNEI